MPLNLNMPTQWRISVSYAPRNLSKPDDTVEISYAPVDRWWTSFFEGHYRFHFLHVDGTEHVWMMEAIRRFQCERI